ncbi:MAG TPA: helix-turn-helix domain-containing protein [Candidatus Sulfotelmatobacter sp.]|nr:helix-turn-helix domain-containing protein [Candidatus Sulfotelmatobacter sp.]
MRIRTPVDLGAFIRQRRIALGLDLKSLAAKVGVSRQWIVEVEKGKPKAEIGLVLRTLDAWHPTRCRRYRQRKSRSVPPPVDIQGSIVLRHRR